MNARSDNKPKSVRRDWAYGVTCRDRRKPWLVKFKRNKRSVHVGSYFHYDEAVLAAERFLRHERSNY